MNPSSSSASLPLTPGTEWVIDALGCDPARLAARATLEQLFARIVADLGLKPVAPPIWHVFPGSAGVTGLLALSESHLACHTFPERGFGAFNLYCCRDISPWPWETHLSDVLGATTVTVTSIPRGVRHRTPAGAYQASRP